MSAFPPTAHSASAQECGPATKGHYKELMTRFPLVVDAFLRLRPQYHVAIADVTRLMGEGMAEFIEKEARNPCGRRLGGEGCRLA